MSTVNITNNIDPRIARRLVEALNALKNQTVRVGLPDSENDENSGLTLAQIGLINELGTGDGRIPARPFMQRGIERAKKAAAQMLISSLEKMPADLAPATLKARGRAALNRVGAYVAGQIKAGIAEGGFAPNAEATIKRKGSSKPLIDTGLLRQSITWLVGEE